MSGVTGQPQEEDKKPNDQSAHINLKVKGQVSFFCLVDVVIFLCYGGLFPFNLYIFVVLVFLSQCFYRSVGF